MKPTVSILLALCLTLSVGACRDEGAAEKAGRTIDEAVEKIQHGDEGALEKAGRKLDEAVDDAEEKLTGDD